MLAGARHGDIEKAAFLGDLVLAAAGVTSELGRDPETVTSMRLREPAFDQGWHHDTVELEALGLVNGHDLDGVLDLFQGRDLLFGLGEQDQLEVFHELLERVVAAAIAEAVDQLGELGQVGRHLPPV